MVYRFPVPVTLLNKVIYHAVKVSVVQRADPKPPKLTRNHTEKEQRIWDWHWLASRMGNMQISKQLQGTSR